jgi:hypothetical protein
MIEQNELKQVLASQLVKFFGGALQLAKVYTVKETQYFIEQDGNGRPIMYKITTITAGVITAMEPIRVVIRG